MFGYILDYLRATSTGLGSLAPLPYDEDAMSLLAEAKFYRLPGDRGITACLSISPVLTPHMSCSVLTVTYGQLYRCIHAAGLIAKLQQAAEEYSQTSGRSLHHGNSPALLKFANAYAVISGSKPSFDKVPCTAIVYIWCATLVAQVCEQ